MMDEKKPTTNDQARSRPAGGCGSAGSGLALSLATSPSGCIIKNLINNQN